MEGRSDKTNRSALDKENKGIKGLVRTTCLKEEDRGEVRGVRVKSSILHRFIQMLVSQSKRRYQ